MIRNSLLKSICVMLFGFTFCFTIFASELQVPPGRYSGAIDVSGMELAIVIGLSISEENDWRATIDIPQQNVSGMGLTEVAVGPEGAVSMVIPDPGGVGRFAGSYSSESRTISGDYTQRGMTFPFSITLLDEGSERASLEKKLEGFNDFVAALMAEWNVPGLAVGIVTDGELVFEKGYGKRDIERDLPVTPETVFPIASVTKSFTAMALAMLVDDGRLGWDVPVREYLPDFRLWDDYATDHVTTRDLLTHRTGLPRHDLVWMTSSHSRDEIYRNLRYLEPSAELRAAFQYNNLMYMTAGLLAGRLAGSSWEEVVKERILEPLSMNSSGFANDHLLSSPDHALGYNCGCEGTAKVDLANRKEIGPAGSINSNIRDMANWLILHLDGGKFGGRDLVSAGQLAEMHAPHIVVPEPVPFDEISNRCYGMGWYTTLYRGHRSVGHEGQIPGFSAEVLLLPGERIGVVALSNGSFTNLPKVAARNVADRLLDLDPIEWSKLLGPAAVPLEGGGGASPNPMQVQGTQSAHPLEEYAGTYAHPAYGSMEIALGDDGGLELHAHDGMELPLSHFHYEVFSIDGGPANMNLTFHTDARGKVFSASAPLEPLVSPIVFERQVDNPLDDPEFVKAVAGVYDLMGMELTLRSSDHGTLILTVPGQPAYDYEPVGELEFKARGWDASYLRFEIDPEGGPPKALLIEPHGNYWATKK